MPLQARERKFVGELAPVRFAHLSSDLCVVIIIASPLVSYWGRPARPNT